MWGCKLVDILSCDSDLADIAEDIILRIFDQLNQFRLNYLDSQSLHTARHHNVSVNITVRVRLTSPS